MFGAMAFTMNGKKMPVSLASFERVGNVLR